MVGRILTPELSQLLLTESSPVLSQQSNATSLNVFKAQNFYSGSQAGSVKLIETLSVFMYSSDFQCGAMWRSLFVKIIPINSV